MEPSLESSLPKQKHRKFWFLGITVIGIVMVYAVENKREGLISFSVPVRQPSDNIALRLNVQRRGEYMHVSWNGNHPSFRKATKGILSIRDGDVAREISFNPEQLANTNVLYGPIENDVIFGLIVLGEQNHFVTQSLPTLVLRDRTSTSADRVSRKDHVSEGKRDEDGVVVTKKIIPSISPYSSSTIHGTIRIDVKVNVEANGEVSKAVLNGPAKNFYFARQALRAAKEWRFVPGFPTSRILRFEFEKGETRASLLTAVP